LKTPLKHNGSIAGEIDKQTFYRKVDPALNLIRAHQGYALHVSLLDILVDKGVDYIVLIEPARRLTSDIEDWQDGYDFYGYKVLPITRMVTT